jgi:hypothetical protein
MERTETFVNNINHGLTLRKGRGGIAADRLRRTDAADRKSHCDENKPT